MTTDSTDTDTETTWASICEYNIWFTIIYFIVYVVACLQLAFCVIFVVLIIVLALWVRRQVHDDVQNSAVGFLDHFTGLGLGSRITEDYDVRLFFLVLLFILLASAPLYASLELYRGLTRNKVENIVGYIIGGAIVLGIRVWHIDSYEYHNFPEDKTVLYCGLYGIFLLMLVFVCVKLRKFK